MATIEIPNEASLDAAARLLGEGRLVAIPTETVYGLAANAWDASAVQRIFDAKGRPSTNPLIVHISSIDQIEMAVRLPLDDITQGQLDAVADLWPGPLTVVLPAGEQIPSIVTAGLATVAVRVPAHPVAQAILKRCAFPIAAPSANRSQYVSPTMAMHCASGLGDHLSMIIDGGPCDLGVESTIVALGPDGPRLLRPGSISAEDLSCRLKVPMAAFVSPSNHHGSEKPSFEAPGMMSEHYSPQTPLHLFDASHTDVPPRTGRIAFRKLPDPIADQYAVVETLSQDGNLDEISRGLFAAIRRLDQAGLDRIVIDVCQPTGLGRAIADRIQRAAAGHRESQ
ncbi:Threonylcarbamoyl-AMP synthase [Rubripirellula lacrimiformis]|uniref:Threonylcarbamoyl-AMP synthase n=1 Tax=Rubripirellula lacrimiformis TaxID=1930273 RepID=A0A517N9N7_9BACT|nr:L-threonylcarbamoyladenylate synthase [Rubripirellula lacrimiformis]QDT03840.1 Threonylcarbamoyl-AMP synthase [Rubripirellula lacrimiformis]